MSYIVVLSGGLDSTCALAVTMEAAGRRDKVRALSFGYGQRHMKELDAAKRIAAHYGIEHKVLYIGGMLSGSALLGEGEVPHGHYADETMSQTVVQGRNLMFAAAAVGQTKPGDTIVLGVHTGDHAIYPDCRPDFWGPIGAAVLEAYDVMIQTPFILKTKAELVAVGEQLDAPLGLTWSCYEGGEIHCGRCGTCVERAEAFNLAGLFDPTSYDDATYWREAVKT